MVDYRTGSHALYDEEASPFDAVIVTPYTSEMWWVEALMLQDQNFESDEWAEKFHRDWGDPRILTFQIFLQSESLNYLAKDDLRFIYQDSTGIRRDGEIDYYELDETKKPIYRVEVGLLISSLFNLQDITWFSLHILNKYTAGRVDMRWDFRKD